MMVAEGGGAALPDIGNFRDYGGGASRFGGHVSRDRLFRSGHLARVEGVDRDRLMALDLDVVCDLRYAGERSDQPSTWPPEYAARVMMHDAAPTADAPHVAVMKSGAFDEAGVHRFYLHYYRMLVLEPLYPGLFGLFLRNIVGKPGRSLIHCSVGKDRTGILAALLLTCLGVGEEAIMADFMASNRAPGIDAMVPEIDKRLREKLGTPVSPGAVRKMLEVEEDYLRAAFAAIDEAHGSVDGFLDAIGVDAARRETLRGQLIA